MSETYFFVSHFGTIVLGFNEYPLAALWFQQMSDLSFMLSHNSPHFLTLFRGQQIFYRIISCPPPPLSLPHYQYCHRGEAACREKWKLAPTKSPLLHLNKLLAVPIVGIPWQIRQKHLPAEVNIDIAVQSHQKLVEHSFLQAIDCNFQLFILLLICSCSPAFVSVRTFLMWPWWLRIPANTIAKPTKKNHPN